MISITILSQSLENIIKEREGVFLHCEDQIARYNRYFILLNHNNISTKKLKRTR